ncbi:MAG: hypothetical protein ABSB76_01025 [Streptosporangiaceae bacterium]|jgi:hypothetical protein
MAGQQVDPQVGSPGNHFGGLLVEHDAERGDPLKRIAGATGAEVQPHQRGGRLDEP